MYAPIYESVQVEPKREGFFKLLVITTMCINEAYPEMMFNLVVKLSCLAGVKCQMHKKSRNSCCYYELTPWAIV